MAKNRKGPKVGSTFPEAAQKADGEQTEKKRMPIRCILLARGAKGYKIIHSSIHENECLAVMRAIKDTMAENFDSWGVVRMRVSEGSMEDHEQMKNWLMGWNG
jgi:hypothetical protein